MHPLAAFACGLSLAAAAATQEPRPAPFFLHVVDAATGRGVPLVELTTVHEVVFVTDSAGVAAIDEPELEGREVWFGVQSHGYRAPADGFGFAGVRARVVRGTSRRVELAREQVAERLYRVTGAGIYRDSVLVGRGAPIEAPLGAGSVFGQDSVVDVVYRGRVFWFWGDTDRPSHPLGNFAVSGATSRLPGDGGLDPAVGVDLSYFVGDDGFSRPMCPIEGPGPVWIDGLCVLAHDGLEVMLCHYARMQDLGTRHEHGLARWHDATERFEKVAALPLDERRHPLGHPVRAELDGEPWLVFGRPFPMLRVRPRLDDVLDPARYEAFTCLREGARFDAAAPALARDGDGALVWAWRRDTDPIAPDEWAGLVEAGHVARGEGRWDLVDVETGAPIRVHGGSIAWNAFRGRWIAFVLELFGRSALGEVFYVESDAVTGPWRNARRVVTHDRYSFYNVRHHPWADQDGGRYVFFEGTYTKTFSDAERATPRYDYNQVMYRLDLADERLAAARGDDR